MSLNADMSTIPRSNAKKIRVLVVDDSALMRKLIPEMLEADRSIEVVGTAMDGTFCLKKIEELRPHVITLDLQMPGMNGIELANRVSQKYPHIGIVLTTGYSQALSESWGARFALVSKPYSISALLETFLDVMARRERGESTGD